MTVVGAQLKSYRLLKEVSQQDLGEAIGVSRSAVSLIEQGLRKLSADELLAACLALDVDPNTMLGYDAGEYNTGYMTGYRAGWRTANSVATELLRSMTWEIDMAEPVPEPEPAWSGNSHG